MDLLFFRKNFMFSFATLWLLNFVFSPMASMYSQTVDRGTATFEHERSVATEATIIAQERLSADREDKIGLTLVKLANHLYPDYRPLLLLRARLQYSLDIPRPSSPGAGEAEFVAFLKRRTASLKKKNNQRDMHLLLVYHSIIRIFDPADEESLVSLMRFSDSGAEMELEKLLDKRFSSMPYHELCPEDPRYAIGNLVKTVDVPADTPWTDTWIKVQAGKIVRTKATRFWGFGTSGSFPIVDADGYDNVSLEEIIDKGSKGPKDKKFRPPQVVARKLKGQKDMNPGCLLGKIGSEVMPLGRNSTFKADSSGILYLGPFEWDSYNDNSGYLSVTIEISDK
ncbi:MAG: hypothetical protein JW808_10030 [Victivallales bacterium]|nr:hypothetical protein [Victivallales bacterium]